MFFYLVLHQHELSFYMKEWASTSALCTLNLLYYGKDLAPHLSHDCDIFKM